MRRKKYFRLTMTSLMMFTAASAASAAPPPVSQIIGLPDAMFTTLVEANCRACHADPTFYSPKYIIDRHHLKLGQPIKSPSDAPFSTSSVSGAGSTYECVSCHTMVWDPATSSVQLATFRDCLFCHKQTVNQANVHHRSNAAKARNCKACHGPINNPNDGHYIPSYASSLITPKPGLGYGPNGSGGCAFCHSRGLDAASGKQINSNAETHHGTGVVPGPYRQQDMVLACGLCHVLDASSVPIRKCEACHGMTSLHNIQSDSNGDYQLIAGKETPYGGHIGSQEDCWGCHGFTSTSVTINPNNNPSDAIIQNMDYISRVTLRKGSSSQVDIVGSAFTNILETQNGNVKLESIVKLTSSKGQDIYLSSTSISEDKLTVVIPPYLQEGNYKVRLVKSHQTSNALNISVLPDTKITGVKCKTWNRWSAMTITGEAFGAYNKGMGPDGSGIDVKTDLGLCLVNNWGDTQIIASCDQGCGSVVTVNTIYGATSAPVNRDALATCVSCHGDKSSAVNCRNKAWRNHLRKKLVDGTTYEIAEKTYLNGLCSSITTSIGKDSSRK